MPMVVSSSGIQHLVREGGNHLVELCAGRTPGSLRRSASNVRQTAGVAVGSRHRLAEGNGPCGRLTRLANHQALMRLLEVDSLHPGSAAHAGRAVQCYARWYPVTIAPRSPPAFVAVAWRLLRQVTPHRRRSCVPREPLEPGQPPVPSYSGTTDERALHPASSATEQDDLHSARRLGERQHRRALRPRVHRDYRADT